MKTLDDISNIRGGETMSPLQQDVENKITTAYLYNVAAKHQHVSLTQFLEHLSESPVEKSTTTETTKK